MTAAPTPPGASNETPLTVLIDDTREFRDGRPRRVARSSKAGVALLLDLPRQHIADVPAVTAEVEQLPALRIVILPRNEDTPSWQRGLS